MNSRIGALRRNAMVQQGEQSCFRGKDIDSLLEEYECSTRSVSAKEYLWVMFARHVRKNGSSMSNWEFRKYRQETKDNDTKLLQLAFDVSDDVLAGWMLSRILHRIPKYREKNVL